MSGVLGQKFKEIEDGKNWTVLFNDIHAESTKDSSKLMNNIAHLPQNLILNRYANVLPYDHSIVKLSTGVFINGSYLNLKKDIGRYYILTQGPLPQTVHSFWLMVWEHNVKCIVMLNRIFEKGLMKCYMYFPGKENGPTGMSAASSLTWGEFQVDLRNEEHKSFYSFRIFTLRNKTANSEREIQQYQYSTWPDHGVPVSTDEFLEFLSAIRGSNALNCSNNIPVVIHCSAGIGRSGTFIISDSALVLTQKYKDTSKIDLKQLVVELRKSRMGLIQTPEQLRFAWKAIVDALDNEKWKNLVLNTCVEDEPVSLRSARSVSTQSENSELDD